jgi:hypothetical protein
MGSWVVVGFSVGTMFARCQAPQNREHEPQVSGRGEVSRLRSPRPRAQTSTFQVTACPLCARLARGTSIGPGFSVPRLFLGKKRVTIWKFFSTTVLVGADPTEEKTVSRQRGERAQAGAQGAMRLRGRVPHALRQGRRHPAGRRVAAASPDATEISAPGPASLAAGTLFMPLQDLLPPPHPPAFTEERICPD